MKRTLLAGLVMLGTGCVEDDPAPEETAAETGNVEDTETVDDETTGDVDDDEEEGPPEYIALIRGELADADDLAAAQATHDAIAGGGQQAAEAAGDFGHDVLLGTTMLDSIENEFLAIDRWRDADAMLGWYANPEFQAAFTDLFAAPPTVEFFRRAPSWENWGDMDAGDSFDPYYFHLALGTLAQPDEEANHTAHDAVAAGGKEPSLGAGNVAHVVYLGLDDARRFVAVDIWSVGEPVEPFYSNPQFRMAFAPLFESVSEPVYASTDWHQW